MSIATVSYERPKADPESWIWAATGHWEAALESIQPAGGRTRGQAAARYASDVGERLVDVAVWKRYARALDRQELWEWHCDERGWYEDDPAGPDGAEREMPATPPDSWEPDPWNEDRPAWEFCRAGDEGAVPVWVCAPAGAAAPHRPAVQGTQQPEEGAR